MQQKNWIFLNKDYDKNEILSAAKRLNISPVIVTLLYNRGITSDSEIQSFLSKSMQAVHNPFLLPDMDKATDRILLALEEKQKICIYGDYDVDGITATVLLYKYLLSYGADVSYYIPDREEEGYGINIKAINKISKTGCKLLITVDCGITATGETELAKAQGMDVIITDHHTCMEKLPAATAVINPKRKDSEYPFPDLAGVGVAFKTVLALSVRLGESTKDVFYKYAPYAAIGTVADVVSLTSENRVIVDRGIKTIKTRPAPGISALLEIAGVKELSAGSIAFSIAPRINAAGRMGSAKTAVELLLSENPNTAKEIAAELDTENQRRRAAEKDIFEEAQKFLDDNPSILSKPVLVIAGECWHKGVVGIVASRLSEKYYKPTILISYEDGTGHGSCRSIEGFNITEALAFSSDLLDKYGGHAMAAGLTVKTENIEHLADKINKFAKEKLSKEILTPKLPIDLRITAASLTEENIRIISGLEPFGEGNHMPVFAICGAEIASCMPMGEEGAHLRLQLKKDGVKLSCVAFRMGELYNSLPAGKIVDIAFTPEINNFGGRQSIQLRIEDIK